MIKFDFDSYVKDIIKSEEFLPYNDKVSGAKNYVHPSKDMMGWADIDTLFNDLLINEINETAKYIQNNADYFLVIGIGGSYLGSRAVIDSLSPYFYNEKKSPKILFLGTSLSTDYINSVLDLIKDKNVIINVISKSGTTFETNVTYDIFNKFMEEKYNEDELKKRIIITTDSLKGNFREIANDKKFKSFAMPNNIGGRYSVFTPVGLLPIAVAGVDLTSLALGAKESYKHFNEVYRYAVIKDILFNKNKSVEAFVSYEMKLEGFLEWLKQLYGESLGKDNKGILPISFINTRDLHSLGQFVQEGNKILFETVFNIKKSSSEIMINKYNKSLDDINNIASESTSDAHLKVGVLNNLIEIDELTPFNIGFLIQFFMLSCAISGYLMEVNPFDQNGVEEYKNIMKTRL